MLTVAILLYYHNPPILRYCVLDVLLALRSLKVSVVINSTIELKFGYPKLVNLILTARVNSVL